MKILFMLVCFPLFAIGQYSGRQDDSLRKISDTTHFPKPFEFRKEVNTDLPVSVLTKKCHDWITSLQDSIKSISISLDTVENVTKASNIPATADIIFSIHLKVDGGQYTCLLHNYVFHTTNGKNLQVDKAARVKDYRKTANIEKLMIMRNHQSVFASLDAFIKK